MSDKLKPCPFCKAKDWKIYNGLTYELIHREWCFMQKNGHRTVLYYGDIPIWNRRAKEET